MTQVKTPVDDRPGQELWIDAFAAPGGDGTRQRPFHRVPSDLHRGVSLHLATGVYAGPLALPDGATVEGHGRAVVALEGPGEVVQIHNATLENLSLQGGTVGLRVRGRASLSGVHFSGHREAAVVVGPAGALSLSHGVFENPVAGADGVRVDGGEAQVDHTAFRSGWRRAVAVTRGTVRLDDVDAQGVTTLLHAVESTSRGVKLRAAGGQGPALFAGQGRLSLSDVEVDGHEYGLQAGNAAVTVTRLTTRRAQYAGVALVNCRGGLHEVTAEDSGAHGAVLVVGGTLTAIGLRVRGAAALGVLLRQVEATIEDLTVESVRGEREADGGTSQGDALHVRGGQVKVARLLTADTAGSALFASMGAHVTLDTVNADRAQGGALFVEREAQVTVRQLNVRGGGEAAVIVPERASVTIGALTSSGPQLPVWAECGAGAEVTLGPVVGQVQQPPAPCIHTAPAAR